MSTDPCTNALAGSQLASACACQRGMEALETAISTYELDYLAWTAAEAEYNQKYREWQTAHSAWETKKNTDLAAFMDQKREWIRCVVWTNVNGHDDWCASDIEPGWVQVSAAQYDCAWGSGKGTCSPGPSAKTSFLTKWAIANPEPLQPLAHAAFGKTLPPLNIQCCTQLFSNITAASVDFDKISQDCSQNIGDQIDEAAGIKKDPLKEIKKFI